MISDYVESVLNASPYSLTITAIAVLLGFIFYITRDRNVPPGPTGVPILGIYPFLKDEDLHLQLDKYVRKYGDISSFRAAGKLFINLGSVKAIREVYVNNSEYFTGRSRDYNALSPLFGDGIFLTNDEAWKTLRKFFINNFKVNGLISMKDNVTEVYDTIDSTIKDLRSLNGEPVDIVEIVNNKFMNTARCTFFGEDGISMEHFRKLIDHFIIALEILAGTYTLLYGTIAKYFVIPFVSGCRAPIDSQIQMKAILFEVIDHHEKTLDENHNRNIIDAYLKDRNERRRKGDHTAEYFTSIVIFCGLSLTKRSFGWLTCSVFGDGHQAIVIFVAKLFLALVQHPEEQEKIYKELVDVVGTDRNPSLEDKSKLPYANAFMYELSRTSNLLPFLPSLVCTKETTLRGYRIPKGSMTLLNFWSAHHDPETFEDPFKFNPSRYLTSSGKPKAELPVTFGIGRRACIGESYSMTLVLLYMLTVVKNFRLSFPKEEEYSIPGLYTMKLKIIATPR